MKVVENKIKSKIEKNRRSILPYFFIFILCFFLSACGGKEADKKDEIKTTDSMVQKASFHEVNTKLTVKEEEEGVTLIYQKDQFDEVQDYYCITQLPFPTFWGGEAYSIITKEGDLYLIDGGFRGEDSQRIASYIEEMGGKVKGWILTHPHVDHIGAFIDYMKDNSHKVETVYYSPFTEVFFEQEPDPEIYEILNNPNAILFYEFLATMEATKDSVSYLPMKAGDHLMLGELVLECFFSFDPDLHDVNGNSLVFTLSYEDFCLALTGDMTEATYEKMKSSLTDSSAFMNPDILQIPHHGYMAGIASDILYRETTPDYVLLDCTLEEFNNNSVNIQNHVQMIEELGIKVIKRFEASEGNKIIIYTGTSEN